jgi:hypothetical protein
MVLLFLILKSTFKLIVTKKKYIYTWFYLFNKKCIFTNFDVNIKCVMIQLMILIYYVCFRLWPGYASAHNNLGTLMSAPDQAEGHFLEAIRHSPNHVNAHYNLGQVYR